MPEPHLRASDADRAAVATALGEHMAAGRLTMEEYDERLTRAYAAKTYGELAELTEDLPDSRTRRPVQRPQPRPAQAPAGVCGPGGRGSADAWRAWLATSVIVTTIWLATWIFGAERPTYFWPVWVIGPWGAVLLASTITRGGRDERDERRLTG
jgi:hypothetical protein